MPLRAKHTVQWMFKGSWLVIGLALAGVLGLAWVLIPAALAIVVMECERCWIWLRQSIKA